MNNHNLKKFAIMRSFNHAAKTYDSAASLQTEIGKRLYDRLDYMRIEPNVVLDVGSGTGYCTRLLAKRYPKANVYAVDFAQQMLLKQKRQRKWFSRQYYICADVQSLPFADQSVDLIFSNLMLHWCEDLAATFAEIHRVLKPQGLLLFSTVGPDTLKELRQSWADIDDYVHVHDFIDMHNIGDALVHNRFADPVMDMEFLTINYRELKTLLYDLKKVGASNIAVGRCQGLMGKKNFQAFVANYERLRSPTGQLPITCEVIYGHAWGADISLSTEKNSAGEVLISIDKIIKR